MNADTLIGILRGVGGICCILLADDGLEFVLLYSPSLFPNSFCGFCIVLLADDGLELCLLNSPSLSKMSSLVTRVFCVRFSFFFLLFDVRFCELGWSFIFAGGILILSSLFRLPIAGALWGLLGAPPLCLFLLRFLVLLFVPLCFVTFVTFFFVFLTTIAYNIFI